MDNKKTVSVIIAAVAFLVGGVLILRNIGGGGGPTSDDLSSMMNALSTEDLIVRRQFMASQIQDAESRLSGGQTNKLLESAQESLAQLDEVLRERGVDPDKIETPDQHDLADAMKAREP